MDNLSLTPAQARVYETLQKIRMAWVALIFTYVCFFMVLVALICAAFSSTAGPSMRWAFGIIDGLIGLALRPIHKHLFPDPQPKTPRTTIQARNSV